MPYSHPSYAHDELAMATMRMRLRLPNEVVAPHEAVYKVRQRRLGGRGAHTLALLARQPGGSTP